MSSPEVVTVRTLADEIASQMGVWTVALPLPTVMLWPVCLFQEIRSRLTGRANVLSRQKYAELSAASWTCDATRLRQEVGFVCATPLKKGVGKTLDWYRQQGWL